MRAVWLKEGQLSIREIETPKPSHDEALVRVLRAGICNTDLELVDGYYPFTGVLGHEFVGVVEQGPSDLLGRRVVGEINVACGACETCRSGVTTHCPNRTVLGIVNRHGAFAEKLTLPASNLHLVPDNLSNEAATLTEPLAAALQVQEQIPITEDQRVLVVGSGKLGQLIARSLAATGCRLTVLGRRQPTLDLLADREIAVMKEPELQERSFDVAIECTGNDQGFELARRSLRPRGTLVMKSTYAADLTVDAAAIVVDELSLIGSRCGPFPPALDILSNGNLAVEDLIEERYPLADALKAFAHAARPGALKVLLQIS